MSIPDRISPIVAYRVWQWDGLGLESLNNEQWFPGCALEANAARCRKEHAAPTDGCTCGVYAARDLAHLQGIGYAGYGVHGEVYLWGAVVEHRLGKVYSERREADVVMTSVIVGQGLTLGA